MSAAPLMPFFTYYGGKSRAAKLYPPPTRTLIIEPFAGSAGYSLRHAEHAVLLYDLDPNIVMTWDYLINAPESEILELPDLGEGQTVDDLTVPPEAKLLIGWWLNKGSSQPKRRPSTFMLRYPQGGPYWGERVRQRIAAQQHAIRHWEVEQRSYAETADYSATWFIDPPYQRAGKHYRFDNGAIDYAHLAEWCRARRGQVIVCEADDADWLPFTHLHYVDSTEGRQKKSRTKTEIIWVNEQ